MQSIERFIKEQAFLPSYDYADPLPPSKENKTKYYIAKKKKKRKVFFTFLLTLK